MGKRKMVPIRRCLANILLSACLIIVTSTERFTLAQQPQEQKQQQQQQQQQQQRQQQQSPLPHVALGTTKNPRAWWSLMPLNYYDLVRSDQRRYELGRRPTWSALQLQQPTPLVEHFVPGSGYTLTEREIVSDTENNEFADGMLSNDENSRVDSGPNWGPCRWPPGQYPLQQQQQQQRQLYWAQQVIRCPPSNTISSPPQYNTPHAQKWPKVDKIFSEGQNRDSNSFTTRQLAIGDNDVLAPDTFNAYEQPDMAEVGMELELNIMSQRPASSHAANTMKRDPATISNYPRYPFAYRYFLSKDHSRPDDLTLSRNRKHERRPSPVQKTAFYPSISAGAMTNLGHFFRDLSKNVHFSEKSNLRSAEAKLLIGEHPLKLLSQPPDDATEIAKDFPSAEFLNAIRNYRPSAKVRSLVAMNPQGYHGSQFIDPNYMWVGLGK